MDQHIMNSDGLSYVDSRIGVELADGSFIIADECAETLMEISDGLKTEDMITKPLRRRLAFIDIVNKGLAPVLLHLEENRDDVDTDKIFHYSMEVLSMLSQPMQCILPKSGHIRQSRETENAVNQLLLTTKRAFVKPELSDAIFQHVKGIAAPLDHGPDVFLSETECHTIDLVIYFYRNLLYIQEPEQPENAPSMNMMIIGMLLRCGFKELCMKLLKSSQRDFWCVSVVQLLSLLFKDNRYSQVSKEGYTGGQEPMESRSGSNLALSTRGTVSSGGSGSQKNRRASAAAQEADDVNEKSDSGTETEARESENGAAIAMVYCASEETSPQSKKDVNFLSPNPVTGSSFKIAPSSNNKKRGRVSLDSRDIGDFTLDEMIEYLREKLYDFVFEFMKEGWGRLIKCIRSVITNQKKNKYQLEGHYFMWLVQHFLRIAQTKELPFQSIRSCLSIDVISLLYSLSVISCEDVVKVTSQTSLNAGESESAARKEMIMGHIRKNYMTVVSMLEFLRAMNYYHTLDLGEEDRNYISSLQNSVVQLCDLRYLFILLLRHYRPDLHNKQYLSDVIVANHEFLLVADLVVSWGSNYNYFDVHEHVCQFATQETMLKYNSILDEFKTNSTGVNNCVFTMMHHVAGDCKRPEVLLQIPIVQNFLNILDMPMIHSIPQECIDLMEYILQQCLGKLETDSLDCIRLLCGLDFDVEGMQEDTPVIPLRSSNQIQWSEDGATSNWTQEEEDEFLILFSRFQDVEPADAQVSDIAYEMQSLGINKSPEEVGRYMMQKYSMNVSQGGGGGAFTSPDDRADAGAAHEASLEACVKYMYETKNERCVHWVQKFFMEYGHVKSGVWSRPAEPVTLHHAALGKPAPLVVYTEWQAAAIKDQNFVQFLQLMGFHVPKEERDGVFPVLPGVYSAKDLFTKAKLIGPVVISTERDIDACAQESGMEFTVDDSQGYMRSDYPDAVPEEPYLPNNMWPLVVQRTNMGNSSCLNQ